MWREEDEAGLSAAGSFSVTSRSVWIAGNLSTAR